MADFINHTKAKIKRFKFAVLARWLILFATLFSVALLVYIGKGEHEIQLHEGDVAPRDIYAPFDFIYQFGLDKEKTEKFKQEAKDRVMDVYDIDAKVAERHYALIEEFFERMKKIKERFDLFSLGQKKQFALLRQDLNIEIANENLKTFIALENPDVIKEKFKKIMGQFYKMPILPLEQKQKLLNSKKDTITVRRAKDAAEEWFKTEGLLTKDQALKQLPDLLHEVSADRKTRAALLKLAENLIGPNLKFNQEETENRKKKAAETVPQQFRQFEVKKNQLIISKGQMVQKEHLAQFKQLTRPLSKTNAIANFLALIAIIGILMAFIVKSLKAFEKKIYAQIKSLLLITIIVLYTLILAKIITTSRLPSYLIPLASSSMLLAILLSTNTAVIVTVFLSILVSLLFGTAGFDIMLVLFTGGIAGIFAVSDIRRRSKILQAGLLIGLINFIVISSRGIINNFEYQIFLEQAGWGFANGILSASIVAVILPLFEVGFKLTTNITLLELSDLNHPLLKELFLKAPGTYHHSIVVGNLAEAASEAIGANSLLARVGSYYHDIGKMEKPEYFAENQVEVKSKHEKLAPTMSRLIITNHVKNGVELARKYNLNNAIIDFIQQHHGTATIFYFFQRALEKVEDEKMLKEESFRYPGPKPQTKEAAIVLLADSVEAASRTLKNPTPSGLKELVQRIINNKFIDGQLDDCELSLRDLNRIAEIFTKILTGIYHKRVEYPEQEASSSDRQ